jgi:alpha-L-fucosidase
LVADERRGDLRHAPLVSLRRPSTAISEKGHFDGQTDVQKKPFTVEDIRFTQSKDGKTIYAIVLELPKNGEVVIKTMAGGSPIWHGKIRDIRLLGVSGKLKYSQDQDGLKITLPSKLSNSIALALKIKI